MFLTGIAAGLSAAVMQDCGYVFSRVFVKRGGTPFSLLISEQFLAGIAGLLFLPFMIWFGGFHTGLWLPLLGSAYGSLIGQYFFFRAGRNMSPARLSAMMGLRVVLLSAVSFLLFGERYHALQVAAIVLAALSAFALNWGRDGFHSGGLRSFGLALCAYVFSDLSVMRLVRGIEGGLFYSALSAVSMVNLLVFVTLLPFFGKLTKESLDRSEAYAAVWTVKQILLYLCYGTIGPVYGNVVMSLRGPLALVITPLLGKVGVSDGTSPNGTLFSFRRIAATIMMTVAIVVYVLD